MDGTTEKMRVPSRCSAWSSRSSGVRPPGGSTEPANPRARRLVRRRAASGRKTARSSVSGTPACTAAGTTCRNKPSGVLRVTENRGSSNTLRSTVAERASITSKTLGTIRRPVVLRATAVRSK